MVAGVQNGRTHRGQERHKNSFVPVSTSTCIRTGAPLHLPSKGRALRRLRSPSGQLEPDKISHLDETDTENPGLCKATPASYDQYQRYRTGMRKNPFGSPSPSLSNPA